MSEVPALTNNEPVEVVTGKEPLVTGLTVDVLPNPSTTDFTLVLISKQRITPVTVRAMDLNGRTISATKHVPNRNIKVSDAKWSRGVFVAEIKQGGERKIVRLVKVK